MEVFDEMSKKVSEVGKTKKELVDEIAEKLVQLKKSEKTICTECGAGKTFMVECDNFDNLGYCNLCKADGTIAPTGFACIYYEKFYEYVDCDCAMCNYLRDPKPELCENYESMRQGDCDFFICTKCFEKDNQS
mgnify:CR=1 FL=1|tara:strand:- start:601 stop:999 length:399 start_codon:yes stop_codon:yes gene_type:complete